MKHISTTILLCAATLLASCTIESSDNGPLDGLWHLERVDTLATGGSANLADGYIFWGTQKDLIYCYDAANGSVGAYYLRFRQTADSLHINKIFIDHGHEDNPDHEQGGDIPVESIDANLRHFGLNALPEHYLKEAMDGSRMTLRTGRLRLKFRKF